MQTKGQLRDIIRERLIRTNEDERGEQSLNIMGQVEALESFRASEVVVAYWSMDREVNTHAFIERWCEKKVILLPVMLGEGLVLRQFTSRSEMKSARFGIMEPQGSEFTELERVGMVLVPGVGFDLEGHRLGHGKGFYDRLLPMIKAPKVGVCFDFQLLENIPTQPHDISVDMVVTSLLLKDS